ncbi:MAG: NUDIX domain-containing protein [Nitrospirae bacterium]|nr:MAG: NUDIX domain-containing protein [Nitrospirota bacterium]
MPLFSEKDIENSYYDPEAHWKIHRLIKEHSTNPEDIRDVAFRDLDFRRIRQILDIGCAFGFSIRGLRGKLKKKTHIVGIDLQEAYRQPWLNACKEIGAIGEFHISHADEIKSYPSASFDLIISSYSLYFFPHLVSEIARLLRPEGTFVAITHSRKVLRELIQRIPSVMDRFGVRVAEVLRAQELLDTFSYEEGENLLEPHFGEITKKLFPNKLRFTEEELERFREYLQMKKLIFFKEVHDEAPDSVGAVLEAIMAELMREARAKGSMEFTKDDGIFICKRPLRSSHEMARPKRPVYCHDCGAVLEKRKIEGKKRLICRECGHIHYHNPLPVTAVIVENERGEILLVKRANQPMRGMWCLPVGFAEADEEIEDAALRELREETGLSGELGGVVDVRTAHNWFYGNLVMITYYLRSVTGQPRAGDDAMEARFFPIEHLPPLAFRTHEKAIQKYLELRPHLSDKGNQ